MGKMAALFFNKPGRILFYLCLTIYLYGDLVSTYSIFLVFWYYISLKKVDSKFVWSEKWILISRIFSLPTIKQAIYGAAVAKSLRDVACTYTPANQSQSSTNISEYDPCWSNEAGNLNRMDAYRIALAVFVVFVGPFAFFNVTKTKYLQVRKSMPQKSMISSFANEWIKNFMN